MVCSNYSEEARNMWLDQDVQWDEERKIRNELIKDILITIQKQVHRTRKIIKFENLRFKYTYLLIRIFVGQRKIATKCRTSQKFAWRKRRSVE